MPLQILNESSHPDLLSPDALTGRTIAVLGFGNQGAAHALNLRDSDLRVIVANRPDTPNGRRAAEAGFDPLTIPEVVEQADLIIIALPDEAHGEVFEQTIAPALKPEQTLGFLHGFSVRFGCIRPPEDVGVVMVAPKGPGTLLRSLFVQGKGLPCLYAVEQENSAGDAERIALAWAAGIGAGRAAAVRTTFADEAESDLFGEQAVLCGGMMTLIIAAFETMVENGYEPEIAYLECCHELKQVVDLLYERGPSGMTRAISNTAEFGIFETRRALDDASLRATLRTILKRIRSGGFSDAFIGDAGRGFDSLNADRDRLKAHAIEAAGQAVRNLMPWLGESG